MKLYYSPGACSLGIHILLQEVGTACAMQRVMLKDGEQFSAGFSAVNPKHKIPVLERDDGSTLTEYGAIAAWIARTHPEAGLIPVDPAAEARAWEMLDYAVATIHMQGYARMVRPGNFSPNPADHEAVKARGREIFTGGLEIAAGKLGADDYVAGSAFSIGDTALFYVSSWARRADIAMPAAVAAHYARMTARPSVQRALAAEGIPA